MKEKTRGIIYKYTNKINGKVYIGQTIDEDKRKLEHRRAYGNYPFAKAIRKYGWDNFDYEVVFTTISSDRDRLKYLLDTMEKYFIKKYNSHGKGGYNCTEGGSGSLGYKHSEETKKKMSESWERRKEIPISEETRRKLSIAGKGRKHTEESKKKMSEVQKGRIVSEESKKKMSEAKKGKLPSRKAINSAIERNSKPVGQYTLEGVLICTYKSASEAGRLTGIGQKELVNVLMVRLTLHTDTNGDLLINYLFNYGENRSKKNKLLHFRFFR